MYVKYIDTVCRDWEYYTEKYDAMCKLWKGESTQKQWNYHIQNVKK